MTLRVSALHTTHVRSCEVLVMGVLRTPQQRRAAGRTTAAATRCSLLIA